MKLSNEVGHCPYCNSERLDYGAIKLTGEMLYYPWECEDCGHKGEEWYDLTFAGHNIETEDGVMMEVDEVNRKEDK